MAKSSAPKRRIIGGKTYLFETYEATKKSAQKTAEYYRRRYGHNVRIIRVNLTPMDIPDRRLASDINAHRKYAIYTHAK
jgi:nucleoside-diphosphate-sugar epimerase